MSIKSLSKKQQIHVNYAIFEGSKGVLEEVSMIKEIRYPDFKYWLAIMLRWTDGRKDEYPMIEIPLANYSVDDLYNKIIDEMKILHIVGILP